MSLTVCCLFVQGEYPYTPEYVSRLKAMVDRWIDRPFQFACLTDQPWLFGADIQTIPIAKLPNCFAYWTKLELFSPARRWAGRVLYLDLDVLIVSSLAPIIDYPAEFALTADPHMGQKAVDRYGRKIVRKFNSSVMCWDGGTQAHLYANWTPAAAARLSGDQCFIAEHAPEAVGLPRKWFPRLSEVQGPPFDPDVKVILSKHPKNHVACETRPWFAPLWGAA